MQSVQTTILNPVIIPGRTPVFIVSPSMHDGENLSVILSTHLIAPRSAMKLGGVINGDNNYFFNNDTIRVTKRLDISQSAKKKEQRDKLRLMMDEGFDSGKLWGLQCDYRLFFELGLFDLYEQAFVLFLYNDEQNSKTEEYLQDAMALHLLHTNRIFMLHTNNVRHLPHLLLRALPLHQDTTITQAAIPTNTPIGIRSGKPGKIVVRLHEHNFFRLNNLWFEGGDLLAILICNDGFPEDILLERLCQLSQAFLTQPDIYILCQSEEAYTQAQQLLGRQEDILSASISITKNNLGLSTALNQLIHHNPASLVLADNLSLSYTLTDAILPFRESTAPVFTCAKMPMHKIKGGQQKIMLADVLTTHLIQDNLLFSRELWRQVKGFDVLLDNEVTLWDFGIRMLQAAEGHAIETEAQVTGVGASDKTQIPVTQTKGYKRVIEKHRRIFQDSLNHVLQLISLKQHLPQHEIRALNYKILTLQALLSHSKDELKALNALSSELQHRINILENKWVFRTGKKINRIRKIFFKKQTPGTSNLKRLIKFIVFTTSKPGLRVARKVVKNGFKKMYLVTEDRPVRIVYLDEAPSSHINTYHDWIKAKLDPARLKQDHDSSVTELKIRPKISIIMPVYNPPVPFLKQAIESVISQLYDDWELCIADDCSPNPQVRKLLNAYAVKDSRIKLCLREENGHISACSNSALTLASGTYFLFMDHDDLLTQHCLTEVVKHINKHPEDELIYSDEDKIDDRGVHSVPHFKPDWAPDNLMSRNYFGHVVVMHKRVMDTLDGFRIGFEGSQDYDLLLRATEVTQHIGHIPKVLYHWRIHQQSAAQSEDVKPYAYIAAKKALEEALVRRNIPGDVHYLSGLRGYRIRYDITKPGKVSIIIPTKDQVKLLKNTIDSILSLTEYDNYEIIILNNNSSSKEFFSLMEDYSKSFSDKFRCIDANFSFNFAKLMNIGVAASSGDYILLLNNDVEIIHSDWLIQMVSYSQQSRTGAVGVKLLYPDDNVQHAGVIVGLGGAAGHAFVNFYKDEPGYFNYIQSVNNFSAVTAACLMVRKTIYNDVGGMDESFEVEYNDVDLCLKIMDAGYYNVYLPDVELYHYESATRGHPHQSKESWERHVREIKQFKEKWQKYIDSDPYYNPNLNLGTHDFSLNFSA